MIRAVALVVLLCIALPARAADVRAWLDRTTMQMGETVTLNVEVSGDTKAPQPDFGVLRQDFDLLGTQSSNSISIVNGQTSAKLLWAVGLQPKRSGTLTIPPLDVAGQRTQPITLTVQASTATAVGRAGDDLYLETTVEPKAPYVQQQVLYTVKLYYALNFTDGGLDDPQVDGVTVHKLGQDAYYTAEVGGRRYRVWERHYALTPEKSGSVTLPSLTFHGHVVDPTDINSFFSRGRAVSARSEPIPLEVRPRPAASGTEAWLPARSVTLAADGIAANAAAHVGEPLTLTLRLTAQGLGFEQLPDLKLPKIDGADVYPDKTTTQNRDDGEWLYGERIRKFAIVPNRPGELHLPEIALSWWDTAHDRAETAEIPAVTLHVQAAPGQTAQRAPVDTPAVPVNKKEDNVPVLGSSSSELKWRWLALGALALWLATLAAWAVTSLKARRVGTPSTTPSEATLRNPSAQKAALHERVRASDWPGSAKALLQLAKAQGKAVRSLGELATALDDPPQAAAVRALDRACFGNRVPADLATALAPLLAKPLRFRRTRAEAQSALPPLYPQSS